MVAFRISSISVYVLILLSSHAFLKIKGEQVFYLKNYDSSILPNRGEYQLKTLRSYANNVRTKSSAFYVNNINSRAIPTPILDPYSRDSTVIVNVPNGGGSNYKSTNYGVPMSSYGMGPYGGYGTVPAAGPTVVVNVPDNDYDNTIYRGSGYTGTGVSRGQRKI